HAFALRLSRGARVDRVAIPDLDRHPAVPEPVDCDDRAPTIALAMPLDLCQPVIDQWRPVQPLPKEPLQVLMRDRFGDVPKRRFVHVLESPARVIRPQDLPHDIVTDDVAQLLEEELPLLVDHRVVCHEVAIALADHRDRLAPAVQVPEQDIALDAGICLALAVRLEEPARLKAREAFVEVALTPLVVSE